MKKRVNKPRISVLSSAFSLLIATFVASTFAVDKNSGHTLLQRILSFYGKLLCATAISFSIGILSVALALYSGTYKQFRGIVLVMRFLLPLPAFMRDEFVIACCISAWPFSVADRFNKKIKNIMEKPYYKYYQKCGMSNFNLITRELLSSITFFDILSSFDATLRMCTWLDTVNISIKSATENNDINIFALTFINVLAFLFLTKELIELYNPSREIKKTKECKIVSTKPIKVQMNDTNVFLFRNDAGKTARKDTMNVFARTLIHNRCALSFLVNGQTLTSGEFKKLFDNNMVFIPDNLLEIANEFANLSSFLVSSKLPCYIPTSISNDLNVDRDVLYKPICDIDSTTKIKIILHSIILSKCKLVICGDLTKILDTVSAIVLLERLKENAKTTMLFSSDAFNASLIGETFTFIKEYQVNGSFYLSEAIGG